MLPSISVLYYIKNRTLCEREVQKEKHVHLEKNLNPWVVGIAAIYLVSFEKPRLPTPANIRNYLEKEKNCRP